MEKSTMDETAAKADTQRVELKKMSKGRSR